MYCRCHANVWNAGHANYWHRLDARGEHNLSITEIAAARLLASHWLPCSCRRHNRCMRSQPSFRGSGARRLCSNRRASNLLPAEGAQLSTPARSNWRPPGSRRTEARRHASARSGPRRRCNRPRESCSLQP